MKFDLNFKTVKGNKGLTLGNIYLILQNPFYYGEFEYPTKSGNWYKGAHEPIITKELFNQVQDQIKSQFVKSETKEFAFTKLMTCGLCGSGITADEKFKKQKNGNIHRHVYYGCTKVQDKNCKYGYINEIDLIKQFESLIESIDINEMELQDKIRTEVDRFKKFQHMLSGKTEKIVVREIDLRNYAKYILREGSALEKRELLGCLRNNIIMQNKHIELVEQILLP